VNRVFPAREGMSVDCHAWGFAADVRVIHEGVAACRVGGNGLPWPLGEKPCATG
jgi:hypothetical protein